MHYDPKMADHYAEQYAREEQQRREQEIHQAIHERLLRLNEEELLLVLQYTRMVYKQCEDRQRNIDYGYPQWNLE